MSEPISPIPRRALLIGGGSALAVFGVASVFPVLSPRFHSVDITERGYARSFSLSDTAGQLRTLNDFRGSAVAVFFGFTQCASICPTALTEMTRVKQLLGNDGDRLQVIFITVDPQRDTPELLEAYMRNFDPRHLALVPTEQQLAELTKEFRIYYKRLEGKTPSAYLIDHSAVTYIYDPQGRVRLHARYGLKPEAVASDVSRLLKEV